MIQQHLLINKIQGVENCVLKVENFGEQSTVKPV